MPSQRTEQHIGLPADVENQQPLLTPKCLSADPAPARSVVVPAPKPTRATRSTDFTSVGSDFEQRLAAGIAQRIEQERYDLWFRKHTKFVLHGQHVVVGVPNLFYQDFLQAQFGQVVRQAVAELLGNAATVQFVIDAELFRAARRRRAKSPNRRFQGIEQAPPPLESKPQTPKRQHHFHTEPEQAPQNKKPARKWKTLSEFVVGACNRVRTHQRLASSRSLDSGANPLVVYGPVGTGKTHLLEGIYIGLADVGPIFGLSSLPLKSLPIAAYCFLRFGLKFIH